MENIGNKPKPFSRNKCSVPMSKPGEGTRYQARLKPTRAITRQIPADRLDLGSMPSITRQASKMPMTMGAQLQYGEYSMKLRNA
eukprot:CAMPEP_0172933354 /NCGR_PEP_ID=MMETSP1075-20121228/220465_1 /TAXON_ID=2916 /ORGANISM="Ceratium fusus, Strain PA161109" /LENGTH=83 /DNA_ID=CAMNT_0013794695 /DNA_START=588 /DNA_END=839 /DNA_ORIENTATION=+